MSYFKNRNKNETEQHRFIMHPSRGCCGYSTLLVKASDGGFIKSKCLSCNKMEGLSKRDFLKLDIPVHCPKCKRKMVAGIITYSNYGFTCTYCRIEIKLAELLPEADKVLSELAGLVYRLPEGSNVKEVSRSRVIISQCVNCRKLNNESCSGASISEGSYDRPVYYCNSYSPRRREEDLY